MLNATTLLAEELAQRLSSVFLRTFGGSEPHIAALLDEAARLIIERLATSDALYHDAEHTALVTLVAQDILRGLRMSRTVSPDECCTSLSRPSRTISVICAESARRTMSNGRSLTQPATPYRCRGARRTHASLLTMSFDHRPWYEDASHRTR